MASLSAVKMPEKDIETSLANSPETTVSILTEHFEYKHATIAFISDITKIEGVVACSIGHGSIEVQYVGNDVEILTKIGELL